MIYGQYRHLMPSPGRRFSPELCPGCPLGNARKVGARGNPESPLVIIGEGPGGEELKYGAPFVGPSGDLIDQCVPSDYDYDDAYVLNAMQCRVRMGVQSKDQALKAKACTACRQRLLDQIFAYPRKAILALGGWSNGALLGDYSFKITQRRGTVYAITNPITGEEIPVVPAVHPAFLLRGGGNIKTFKEDIAEALSLAYDRYSSQRHQSVWEDPEVRVLHTAADVQNFWELLLKFRSQDGLLEMACDIETSGFNHLKDRILCIGFYPDLGIWDTGFVVPEEVLQSYEVEKWLRIIFEAPWIKKVWQFGKFDEKFLRHKGLISEEWAVEEDSGLLSYALSEATKDHDLDEQAKNLLGAPDHKHVLKQWAPHKTDSYELVPPPVLWDYLAKDVKKTLLCYQTNRQEVRNDPVLEKLYTKTLIPASHLLAEIENYGICVDWDYVRINRSGATQDDVNRGLVTDLESEMGLEREMERTFEELEQLVGYKVNPNSPDEVSELLYDRLGLTIKGVRPQSTAKELLDKLPPHPAVKLVRKYRSQNKMLSTYVAAIEKQAIDDIIHTTYKLHVTPTGRLSSSEPNIQNIPREPRLRRMYCARPNHKLMEGDYNSAELRMLAVLSGDKFLTGVFLDDKRNLHDEVSIAMYGPNFDRDQRIRAKAINFGIPYGREAFSIAFEFDMPEQEAQRLIDAWLARAPEAAAFLKVQRRAAREGKTLVTVFGRKRRPGVVSQERLHGLMNEFANFHMQSPISDFTLHSGMIMLPKLKKEGAHIVNLVHDSVLTEYPDDSKDREQQVAGIIKETMETVPTYWITTPIRFKVDLKSNTHWGLLGKYELQ